MPEPTKERKKVRIEYARSPLQAYLASKELTGNDVGHTVSRPADGVLQVRIWANTEQGKETIIIVNPAFAEVHIKA